MIFLDNATPPSKEQITHSSPFSQVDRRLSTSTTSPPPPYEATTPAAPSFIRDEKLRLREERRKQPSSPKAPLHESRTVYKEPPSEFSRAPAVNFQNLKPFDPLAVLVGGSGRSLDKGLSLELPPSIEEPHPFTQRDISTAEWQRFMQDLRNGTAISDCAKQRTLLIPLLMGLGPGAFFVSNAVKAKIRRKKLKYAIDLINTWNQYFFAPRGVEVILMRGDRPLTLGNSIAKHSTKQVKMHHGNLSSDSVSSSTSSSSSSSPEEKEENSGGCCNQPRTPMRLIVVPT